MGPVLELALDVLQVKVTLGSCQGYPLLHSAGGCPLEPLAVFARSRLLLAVGRPPLNFACTRRCLVEVQLVENDLQEVAEACTTCLLA